MVVKGTGLTKVKFGLQCWQSKFDGIWANFRKEIFRLKLKRKKEIPVAEIRSFSRIVFVGKS